MAGIKGGKKGQVLVLVALFLFFVILGLGVLAIDVGRAYGVRTKLYAAVDAAALAAGRAVGQGASAVETQAIEAFNANFTEGMLGCTLTGVKAKATANRDSSWTISVDASATLPSCFAPVFLSGLPAMPVAVSAETTVRTLDLMLVIDTSYSLNTPKETPTNLKKAALRFVKRFDTKIDRVGLIRYASGAVLDVPISANPGFNLSQIEEVINNISCKGATASEDAVRLAKAQLDAVPVNSRNSLRVIVFFTDGAPNTFAGSFSNGVRNLYSTKDNMGTVGNNRAGDWYETHKIDASLGQDNGIASLPETDYTRTINLESDLTPPTRLLNRLPSGLIANTKCNANRAARNMLENIANACRSEPDKPIRIFTIGLGDMMTRPEVTNSDRSPSPGCGYGNEELGQNILRRLANVPGVDTYNANQPSGIYAFAADPAQLDAAFNQVANQLLRLSK